MMVILRLCDLKLNLHSNPWCRSTIPNLIKIWIVRSEVTRWMLKMIFICFRTLCMEHLITFQSRLQRRRCVFAWWPTVCCGCTSRATFVWWVYMWPPAGKDKVIGHTPAAVLAYSWQHYRTSQSKCIRLYHRYQ